MTALTRQYDLYLKDILDAIEKIEKYTEGIEKSKFIEKDIVLDAVMRNFQVIGDAANELPEEFKEENDEVEWRKVQDFRNIVVHKYWEVDKDIAWEIVEEKIPELKRKIKRIRNRNKK